MNRTLVIVVTFNGRKWMDGCLGSLRRSARKADVLVVDNASTDGTAEYVREHFPGCRLLACQDNLGFGQANNLGLESAVREGYEFVYLLNQDARVTEETIGRLEDACRPGYGILSPIQKGASGRLDANFQDKCGALIQKGGELVKVPFVMAAHWLVDVRALKTIGGFSPAFPHYGEDDTFIDRVHWWGLSCGVVPAASAVHDRAERKTPRSKRLELKCISTVVKLSNPGNCFFGRMLWEPLALLGMSVKNFSTVPAQFIPTLVKRYPELRERRKESRKKAAFL